MISYDILCVRMTLTPYPSPGPPSQPLLLTRRRCHLAVPDSRAPPSSACGPLAYPSRLLAHTLQEGFEVGSVVFPYNKLSRDRNHVGTQAYLAETLASASQVRRVERGSNLRPFTVWARQQHLMHARCAFDERLKHALVVSLVISLRVRLVVPRQGPPQSEQVTMAHGDI